MPLYFGKTKNDIDGYRAKVAMRGKYLPGKKTIAVCDAFSGDMKIWTQVIAAHPKTKFEITRIEKSKKCQGNYFQGDNRFYLQKFDLSKFDIIDLDDYSFPFDQLKIIFDKKYCGFVHFTFIQRGFGTMKKPFMKEFGFSEELYKRSYVMFSGRGFELVKEWLAKKGVKELKYHCINKKYYCFFSSKY